MLRYILVPEMTVLLVPFMLYIFGLMNLNELLLIYGVLFVFIFFYSYIRVSFPKKTNKMVDVLVAPEESASRIVSHYLCKMCYQPCNKYAHTPSDNCIYLAIATPSIMSDHVRQCGCMHMFCDTSSISSWGIPSLGKLLTYSFIYLQFLIYLFFNHDKIRSILVYSSPDMASKLFPHVRKKYPAIKLYSAGVPEKEVIKGKPGKQTEKIFINSDKIILPISGGKFDAFYRELRRSDFYKDESIVHCKSHFILEHLQAAAKAPSYIETIESRKDIIVLLGSRIDEINCHLPVLRALNNVNLDCNIVLLSANSTLNYYLNSLIKNKYNFQVIPEDEYSYSNAKIAICKSGASLIKCVVFGIPTIPFYIPNFRTYLYFKYDLMKNNKFDIKYVLLPHLIVGDSFLTTKFLGKIDQSELTSAIRDYFINALEKYSADYAKKVAFSFLGEVEQCNGNCVMAVVNEYQRYSARNLVNAKKELKLGKISDDIEKRLKQKDKLDDILSFTQQTEVLSNAIICNPDINESFFEIVKQKELIITDAMSVGALLKQRVEPTAAQIGLNPCC